MRFNWPTQLGGVIITAVIVWLVVFEFSYSVFNISVPLEIVGLDQKLAVVEKLTNIEVTIRSKNFEISKVKNNIGKVRATIDLEDNGIGEYQIEPEVGSELSDARIIDYHPKSFGITIVPAIEKRLKLIPDILGFPDAEYSLGEINIIPSEIEVVGPSNLLNLIDTAFVPINISNRKQSFSMVSQPEIRDEAGDRIANFLYTPKQVTTSVEIKAGASFKTVGLEPAFSGTLLPGFWIASVEFSPPALTIKGSAEEISVVESLLTTPINLSDQSSDFNDKVSVEVPTGVNLLEPNIINVKVVVKSSSNNRQLILLPSYTNITEGLSVTSVSPPTVTVILSGPPDKLTQLNRANTLLDLDLRGSLSGTNSIILIKEMFKVPEDIEVVSFVPQELEIILTKSE